MQSRRVFLKNGAFAFVSLGFAPSFLARSAERPFDVTWEKLNYRRAEADGVPSTAEIKSIPLAWALATRW